MDCHVFSVRKVPLWITPVWNILREATDDDVSWIPVNICKEGEGDNLSCVYSLITGLTWKLQTSNGSWCMGIKVKCPARFVSHLHEICIYIWVVYSLCFFCCLFITVTWWYVWCFEWASGNQEEVQACLVTLWLFIISCYSLYKTTLGLLCSWFENNPHFHKYSMDFHV